MNNDSYIYLQLIILHTLKIFLVCLKGTVFSNKILAYYLMVTNRCTITQRIVKVHPLEQGKPLYNMCSGPK